MSNGTRRPGLSPWMLIAGQRNVVEARARAMNGLAIADLH